MFGGEFLLCWFCVFDCICPYLVVVCRSIVGHGIFCVCVALFFVFLCLFECFVVDFVVLLFTIFGVVCLLCVLLAV